MRKAAAGKPDRGFFCAKTLVWPPFKRSSNRSLFTERILAGAVGGA